MLDRAARRSGNCDDEGRASWDNPKMALGICLAVGVSVLLFVGSLFHGMASSSKGAELTQLPSPPSPYKYNTFMNWLRATDFSKVSGMKWRPEVEEFDIDAAASGSKFKKWLAGDDATKAISATKSINKYAFFGDIMTTGDLTTVGAPGTHLYILTKLLPAAVGVKAPSFLDAGCGVGYLLPAWVLATEGHGRAVGVEVDASTAASAESHLTKPDAYDEQAAEMLKGAEMTVRTGDVFGSDAAKLTGLEPGTVDAINLGAAVQRLEDLAPLVDLLRIGGLLAAPICLPSEAAKGLQSKCSGLFEIFQKKEDGSIERQAEDPDIPVNFVMVHTAPTAKLRGGR